MAIHRWGVLTCLLLASHRVEAQSPPSLELSRLTDEGQLAALLWERSPDLEQARAKVESARADLERAHLLPNPGLDLGWGTIPVGTTNPPGLVAPLAHIPNYSVALSVLLELGKRGWRQEAARSSALSAALDAYDLLRQRYYELLEHVGELAAAEVRIARLKDLSDDTARLTQLQRLRADHGDAAELDVDRAALEEEKLSISLREERARFSSELLACSRLVGTRCEPFGTRERASAFLQKPVSLGVAIEERPDLRSLQAQERSARATAQLASNHAIPDPTVKVGYVRDQFVISGNQQNSLFVGLSLPLPVFDHGQADAHAALAQARAARRTHSLLVEQAHRDLDQLGIQAKNIDEHRTFLRQRVVPLARSVVQRLEQAVQRGGASMTELLLVRRTLGELLIDDVDLDLEAFRIRVTSQRVTGAAPPAPQGVGPPS